jgi:flagellar capping protein FliD
MSTISSLTSSANSAYSSTGLSGLVSGMDTEQMVEDLLSGTQAKIDAQKAKQQQLVWKQEIYRDVVNDLNSFQEKFFSYTSDTNLLSSTLFNSMTAATASHSVSVSAAAGAATGTMTINSIQQLAASLKEKSALAASGTLEGALDLESITKEITLTVGAATQTFRLSGKTDTDLLQNLNASLTSTFGTSLVEGETVSNVSAVADDAGNLTLNALDADAAMSITGTAMGLAVLGLTDQASGTGSLKGALDAALGTRTITVNLDGVSKLIELDTDAENAENFTDGLQSALDRAFGNGIVISQTSGLITFGVSDNSRQITITGASDAMDVIGLSSGQSNKINLSLALAENHFAQELQGSAFKFAINGIDFEFCPEDSLAAIIAKVNASDADVKISYASIEDKFIIESKISGSGTAISMTQETGNLLSSLFGIGSSGSVAGMALQNESGAAAAVTDLLSQCSLDTGNISIKVGDADAIVLDMTQLPGAADPGNPTIDDLRNAFNTALGGDGENPKVLYDAAAGKFQILEMTGQTVICGSDQAGAKALQTMFGTETLTLNSIGSAPDRVTAGQNAILTVNGIQVERNNNSFMIDGVSIRLLQTSDQSGETGITINTTRNTDKILDAVTDFVNDYNKLIGQLNALINEAPSYKSYPPLTSAQKAEMSEKEIELWETKAKTGLIRRDDTITNLLSNMRSALYTRIEDSKYALYDLGINTGDWQNKGKLVLDNPPAALLEALENDPAGVERLFNNESEGLAVQLNKLINGAAKISSGSPGTLVGLAGAASLSRKSSIDQQVDDLDEGLDRLQEMYEKERNRYWKQFNTMETLISEMNSMSSWLSSQFE